ncbi:MAG: glycosyltransferase [Myxococcales bacterium]|nr:glycosyltransferase [Myxococcales bacterium]
MQAPPESVPKRLLGLCPLLGAALGVTLVFLPLARQGLPAVGRALVSSPILVLVVAELMHLAFLTALWLRYRPVALPPDEALPVLTVIIPAYNEGPMVEQSIRSVAGANYPHDKLEILVVDDGSRDDTFFHMEKLRKLHPQVVRLIRFRGNQGKRAALRTGFESARGDIVITIDSDSEIEPDTLRALAAPFSDPRVGGVAGWVRVLNSKPLIGRMLDVQFTLSFDLTRAAQSIFGAVFVCPGALSAFRRSVILPFMDEWVNQSFLGRPVGHGEDQALTNIVLKAGFHTAYQRNAVVWTLVPQTYRQLTRMLTRWDRSYVVEGFSFAKFMFTKYRDGNRVFPILGFFASTFRLFYVFVGLVALPAALIRRPDVLVAGLAAGFVMAALSSLYYLRARPGLRFLWGAVYAVYAFTALLWILPYAIVTVRDERWGTR